MTTDHLTAARKERQDSGPEGCSVPLFQTKAALKCCWPCQVVMGIRRLGLHRLRMVVEKCELTFSKSTQTFKAPNEGERATAACMGDLHGSEAIGEPLQRCLHLLQQE